MCQFLLSFSSFFSLMLLPLGCETSHRLLLSIHQHEVQGISRLHRHTRSSAEVMPCWTSFCWSVPCGLRPSTKISLSHRFCRLVSLTSCVALSPWTWSGQFMWLSSGSVSVCVSLNPGGSSVCLSGLASTGSQCSSQLVPSPFLGLGHDFVLTPPVSL